MMKLNQTILSVTVAFMLSLSLLVSPTYAQSQEREITDLFQAWSQVTSEKKSFKEEQYDPLLDLAHTQFGTLVYQAPDQLEQHYETPLSGVIVVTSTLIKIDFPNRKLEFSVDISPEIVAFSQLFLNLLNGRLDRLQNDFNVTFIAPPPSKSTTKNNQHDANDESEWQLILTPTSSLKHHIQRVQVVGVQTQIQSILLTQRSGEWRKITLQEPQTQPANLGAVK